MSFFGMGRPQPSSAEKIAAVEQEMKLMASMHNRYVCVLQPNAPIKSLVCSCTRPPSVVIYPATTLRNVTEPSRSIAQRQS